MQFGAKSRKFARNALLVGAILMILVGLLELVRVPLAYFRAGNGQREAATQPAVHIQLMTPLPAKVVSYRTNGLYPPAAAPGKQPPSGALVGHLKIPFLRLDAPITQGTALSVLAKSAGHLVNSVLPGEIGTTVIAAHDVTYFHHIDKLQPGDIIRIQTSQGIFTYKVTSHKVIHVGTNVVNTPYPSLVLETCYPLSALNLVDRRYIVIAVLTQSKLSTPAAS